MHILRRNGTLLHRFQRRRNLRPPRFTHYRRKARATSIYTAHPIPDVPENPHIIVTEPGITPDTGTDTDNKKRGGRVMRSEEDASRAIDQYADTVRRICMVHLKNYDDTEDIFQTVFLKYVLHSAPFDSEEHEKAWIIRVTINACKDFLKNVFRRRTVPLDQIIEKPQEMTEDHSDLLEAVLALPEKYKDVIYLYYYEGYSAAEIGSILKKNVNTVYTLLTRARQILKTKLEGVIDDE